MHADGKSTLASVSKWNSGKVNFIRFFAINSVVLTYAFHKISPPKTLLNRKLKKPHVGINCIESSETVIGNKQKV